MTDKPETLRKLLDKWGSIAADMYTRDLHTKDDLIYADAIRHCKQELAPIVKRAERMVEDWREASRLMQKLPFSDMDPAAREAIRQLNERADEVEREVLGGSLMRLSNEQVQVETVKP